MTIFRVLVRPCARVVQENRSRLNTTHHHDDNIDILTLTIKRARFRSANEW